MSLIHVCLSLALWQSHGVSYVTVVLHNRRGVTPQRPSATVHVLLGRAFASTDLVFSPTTLAFESDGWFVPQLVALTAPQDEVDEGLTYVDSLRANSSCSTAGPDDDASADEGGTCAEFDGLSTRIDITVIDDDEAGIVLGRNPLRILVDAAGDCFEAARYTLRLTSRPTHNVTLAVLPTNDYISFAPPTITVMPEHWNATRVVDVCAHSPKVEAFVGTMLHTVSSRDTRYDDDGDLRLRAVARGAPGGFATPNATARVRVRLDGLPAPTLKRVQFFDSGAGATITFDEDTNRAGLSGVWPCEKLFNNSRGAFSQVRGPGIGYLGLDPSCAWGDAATVLLTFGLGATVLPRRVLF